MADETTNIHDVAANFDRANRRLDSLAQTGGAAGTAQRAMKGDFQNAYNYSTANDFADRARGAKEKAASNGFQRFAAASLAKPAARVPAGNGGAGYDGRLAADALAQAPPPHIAQTSPFLPSEWEPQPDGSGFSSGYRAFAITADELILYLPDAPMAHPTPAPRNQPVWSMDGGTVTARIPLTALTSILRS